MLTLEVLKGPCIKPHILERPDTQGFVVFCRPAGNTNNNTNNGNNDNKNNHNNGSNSSSRNRSSILYSY